MPRIDFSFSGWVRNADVTKATDCNGKEVDVSAMDDEELAKKLRIGELFISLGDHLYVSNKEEVEIFDFEAS